MRRIRRTSQIIFLALFLYLLARTAFPLGAPRTVGMFLLLDPLVALSTFLAGRILVGALLWSLLTVASAVVAGRCWCGWACPFGTTLDIFDRLMQLKRLRARVKERRPRRLKYLVLSAVLVFAIFGLHISGWVDPISIATRTYTALAYPLISGAAAGALGGYGSESFAGQAYSWLQEHGLPVETPAFDYWWLIAALFAGLLALQVMGERFWCRNLCPLGALLALFSRIQLVRLKVAQHCHECGDCIPSCKMAAIEEEEIIRAECVMCFNCVAVCPVHAFELEAGLPTPEPREITFDTGRRVLLTAAISAVPALFLTLRSRLRPRTVVRPPGVGPEEQFLATCTRCGQCLKVCPTNFLQASFLESGIAGIFTPRGNVFRGYCEHNCTLCGQVCPTGAIPRLTTRQKHHVKFGIAKFVEKTCLPFAENTNCIVCEEHCPVPGKAIRLEAAGMAAKDGPELRKPYLIADLCTGCGICVNKCPVKGRRGIELYPLPQGF